MRIVLVDDQAMFREGLTVLLQHAIPNGQGPVAVRAAASAREGLDILLKEPGACDLVLLEFFLPDESGAQMIGKFVAAAGSAPVVIISSGDSSEDARVALSCGAKGYLSKSVSFRGLTEFLSLVGKAQLDGSFTVISRDGIVRPAPLQAAEAGPSAQVTDLSIRQREITRLVSNGCTNKEIARALGMQEATVKSHLRLMLRHRGLKNRTQLAIQLANNSADPQQFAQLGRRQAG